LTVKVGTTVTWTNQDSAPHTVTADDNSWGSGRMAKGGQYSFSFDQPGTYPYHCGAHPAMTGTIIVNP
jgi:plastocyanin